MIYHHRGSVRPDDVITVPPLPRFHPVWNNGPVVISWRYQAFKYLFSLFNNTDGSNAWIDDGIVTVADTADDRSFYLPTSTTDEIIHHPYYSHL